MNIEKFKAILSQYFEAFEFDAAIALSLTLYSWWEWFCDFSEEVIIAAFFEAMDYPYILTAQEVYLLATELEVD